MKNCIENLDLNGEPSTRSKGDIETGSMRSQGSCGEAGRIRSAHQGMVRSDLPKAGFPLFEFTAGCGKGGTRADRRRN